MLRKAMGIAGGLLLGGAALAQSPDPVSTGWRPVLGAGLTVGGDTVAKFQMNDGSTKTLSGGGFVHLYGGVHRQFGLWAVQATFGYQVDDVVAQNGSAKFERYPLEVLAQYQATEAIAVGAGLRHVSGAKYSSSGAAASQSAISSASLSVATSPFLEGDYAFSAKAHFSVKLVSETYKDPWGGSFKGDHIGFYLKGIL
jgi:hypothetical protein